MTSDQCTALIRSLPELSLLTPGDEYALRERYVEVLEHALSEGEIHYLYDVWWSLHHPKIRGRATRGFYLDLWDEYLRADGLMPGMFGQAEKELLRAFVGLSSKDFTRLIEPDGRISPQSKWKEHLGNLIGSLVNRGGPETAPSRRVLYSMSRLYATLYEAPLAIDGKAVLAAQLEAAHSARACLVPDSGPVLDPIADLRDHDPKRRGQFVTLFAYLYGFLDHFQQKSLAEWLDQVAIASDLDEIRREDLIRLVKYWAATTPLVADLLADKCNYAFHTPAAAMPAPLPAHHGTDNFICVVGLRQVGKTHFLFASEAASKKSSDGQRLHVRHIDEMAVGTNFVENLRATWEKATELTEENDRQGFATQDQSVYAHTDVQGLCRFNFNDIPGEDLWSPNQKEGVSHWLKTHFKTRKPCAILLMFQVGEIDCAKYVPVIDLLHQAHAASGEARHNLPVYFVLNKSDQLLTKDASGKALTEQLAARLNARKELRPGFPFFSVRYEQGLKSADDLLRLAQDNRHCCESLPFAEALTRDLTLLRTLIDRCLEAGLSNLSLVYTTCLAGTDPEFGAVRALWKDLRQFVGSNTVTSRKQYYREKFHEMPGTDFEKAAEFARQVQVTGNLELFDADLQGKIEPNGAKADQDFLALQKALPEQLKSDFTVALPTESPYRYFTSWFTEFDRTKKKLTAEIDAAVPYLLRELGVPEGKKISELGRIFKQHVVSFRRLPIGTTSKAARSFVAGDEFKKVDAQFRTQLLQAITQYNARVPEQERLVLKEAGVGDLAAQLPGLLWSIDAVNKREVAFDNRLGALSTLCPFADRPMTNEEKELLNRNGQTVSVLAVFLNLANDENVQQLDEKTQDLCELLKNYAPRYSQFAFEMFDLDRFKDDTLRLLSKERRELDETLIELTASLLTMRRDLASARLKPEEISQRFQAKYLLGVLKRQKFNTGEFLKNPAEVISHINVAILALGKGKRAGGWWRIDQAARDAAMMEVTNALSKVWTEAAVINEDRFDEEADPILRKLNVALTLFQVIQRLADDTLVNLDTYKVKDFALTHIRDYSLQVDKYVHNRKVLLLWERANYLMRSGWLEGVAQIYKGFLPEILVPERGAGAVDPNLLVPEILLKLLQDAIQTICDADPLWKPGMTGSA